MKGRDVLLRPFSFEPPKSFTIEKMEVVFLVAVATGAVAFLTHNLLIIQHQDVLHRFCAGLGHGSYRTEFQPGAHVWRKRTYSYYGTFQGRSVTIAYTFQPGLRKSERRSNTLEIQIPVIQKFWLRLLTDYHEVPPFEEILTGVEPLDQHFVIHSNQPEVAATFLQNDSAGGMLNVLQYLFAKLEIYRGALRLTYMGTVIRELSRIDLEIILETLSRMILLYESQSATFRVVPLAPT